MKIYEDHNGVETYELLPEGHNYNIEAGLTTTRLIFQNGPIKEVGINGITNEALIAVLIHRIKYLNGKFPCRENSIVLTKLEESLMWLESRTKERMERGVEGESKA